MGIQTNTVFLSGPPLVCPIDLFGFNVDIPPLAISEILFRYVADRRLVLAKDFVGSVSNSEFTTTGITIYTIQRNGFNIGTITFPIGGTVGAFVDDTELGNHIIQLGDTITIVAPLVPDFTHARISWTLQATFS